MADGAVPARPGSDVFISYSRRDRAAVERLTASLEARGRSAWVDFADIPPTAEWMAEIRSAIDAADTIVVVLSPDSVASPVCTEELEAAVDANKRIVPVVVRDVAAAEVPPELAKRNWLFLRDEDDFEVGVDTLVTTLETDLEATRFHTGLLLKAREWQEAGGSKSKLLRGSDLTEAESYFASPGKGPAPTQEQTSFVLASRRAATRRQRSAVAIAVCVALVAATMGVFAWTQRSAAIANEREAVEQRKVAEEQTRIATSRALAAKALLSLDRNLDLGILLALEAHRAAPTPEATEALHIAAQRSIWIDRTLRGHEGRVTDVAYSPDGTSVVSGGDDGSVIALDRVTARPLGEPIPVDPEAGVVAIDLDETGDTVAAAGRTTGAGLWDLQTGDRILGPLTIADQRLSTVALSPDGEILVAGTVDGSVVQWDAVSGARLARPLVVGAGLGDAQEISSLAFSPDGATLAIGTRGGTIAFVVPGTDDQTRTIHIGQAVMTSVAFSPDGDTLAIGVLDRSSAADGDVIIRSLTKRGGTFRLVGHTDTVVDLAYSPDGLELVSASVDGTIRQWDLLAGEQIGQPMVSPSGSATSVAYAPDGAQIVTGGDTGALTLWNAARRAPTQGRAVNVLAFSPDGTKLATTEPYEQSALSTTFGYGALGLWDPSTLTRMAQLPLERARPYGLGFSPDGSRLFVSGLDDGVVQAWDLESPTLAWSSRVPVIGGRWLNPMAIAPDGTTIAVPRSDGQIFLLETDRGRIIDPALKGFRYGYAVSFGPLDDRLAAGSDDGVVRTWATDAWQVDHDAIDVGARGIMSIAFAPDGSVLGTGGFDERLTLVDPDTGATTGSVEIGEGIITVAFSPDGSLIAAGTESGAVVLIDRETLLRIGEPILSQQDWVNGLAFSPDGQTLAAGSEDGSLILLEPLAWTDDIELITERLCAAAGRNLAPDEWQALLPEQPYRQTCGTAT